MSAFLCWLAQCGVVRMVLAWVKGKMRRSDNDSGQTYSVFTHFFNGQLIVLLCRLLQPVLG